MSENQALDPLEAKDYFRNEAFDDAFFAEYIDKRLPAELVDFHTHITRPEDTHIPPEMVAGDWALQCGCTMTQEDYIHYSRTLWKGRRVIANVFPMPIRGVELASANDHLYDLISRAENRNADALVRIETAAMAISPAFDADECAEQLRTRGFIGYKPYPDLVAGAKGADICIFDFIPDRFLKTLDTDKKAVILHLPRAGRLADPSNVRELCTMRQKYPDIKIVIAHYGRSYNIETAISALEQLGDDIGGFYFDTAAVVNPAVHAYMLQHIEHDRIFYGTDLPLLRWHGRRTWENKTYQNHARERFPWNEGKHEPPEAERRYTFFMYEQVHNMLDVLEEHGGQPLIDRVFRDNAKEFLKSVRN